MSQVDFSYITPRYLENVQSSLLWQTAEQYRYAADLLRRNPVQASMQLRAELLNAVRMLEDEMARRVTGETGPIVSGENVNSTGATVPMP